MYRVLILIAVVVTFAGCSNSGKVAQPAKSPTVESTQDSAEKLLNEDLQKILREESGKDIEPLLVTTWFPVENTPGMSSPKDIPVEGWSVRSLPQQRAGEIFDEHYDTFLLSGYLMFLTNLDFDDKYNSLYDLAVIAGTDQYDILRVVNTEAPNYDLTNDEIVGALKQWEADVEFRIKTADEDRVEADILQMPDNVEAFAIKIYDLSPDTVYQGAGSLEAVVTDIKEDEYFWMWWD